MYIELSTAFYAVTNTAVTYATLRPEAKRNLLFLLSVSVYCSNLKSTSCL